MTGSKGLWALLAAALLGAGAGPFIFPGPSAEAVANQQRIAALSPLERERLDQKLKAYEALSPEQRESLKKLHRDLAEDAVQSKGLYSAIMSDYVAWIGTVPAYRRDEILQATDPAQRINEIREVLNERHSRTVEGPPGEPGGPGLPARLSGGEMARIMQILEQHVRNSLGQEEQTEFDRLSEAFRQAEAAAVFSERLGSGPAFQGAFAPLINEIASTLDRPMLRDIMRQPQDGGRRMVYWMNLAMLTTAERNLKRELANRRVRDAELEGYFKSLPADQQDTLTNLSADDFRSDLRMRYLGQETAVVKRLEGELRRMRQMQGGGGPFNPGFRPGRNDQPPGPPPPRDREGGRPPEFGRDGRDDRRPPPEERDGRRPPPEGRGDRGDNETGDRPRPPKGDF